MGTRMPVTTFGANGTNATSDCSILQNSDFGTAKTTRFWAKAPDITVLGGSQFRHVYFRRVHASLPTAYGLSD
jgi:hypothetical protein